MKTAVIFALFALLFFLLSLYSLDLLLFFYREKKRFEAACKDREYVLVLEQKQKKARHPQKKNFYLYLICLSWLAMDQREKVLRLIPFLRNDALLGVTKENL